MKHSQAVDEVIAIRPGLRLPVILFCIAAMVVFLGALFFMPFIHDRNPTVGFGIFGVAAVVGIMGYLRMRDRRPRVYLTRHELQLPGYGIERISWHDIVRTEAINTGDGWYLGIDLRPAARERVGQPPMDKSAGEFFCAVTGRQHDLVLMYPDVLEWTVDQLADEINRRASDAAAPAGR